METGNNSGTEIRKLSFSKSISIIDESLQSGEHRAYHLTVEVGPAAVSYALLDIKRKKYVALESFIAAEGTDSALLEAVVAGNDILRRPPASAAVITGTNAFTLVPAPLYDADRKYLYLKYNHALTEAEFTAADEMKACGAWCLYAAGRDFVGTVQRLLPGARMVHQCTVLTESFAARHKHSDDHLAFVHVRDGAFDMVTMQGGRLVFCNTFRYATDEDFLYYILFVLEQLRANPDAIPVSLCGAVNKTDDKYRLLLKYVRNTGFAGRPADMEYSYGFHELPEHHYYTLLNQYLCAS